MKTTQEYADDYKKAEYAFKELMARPTPASKAEIQKAQSNMRKAQKAMEDSYSEESRQEAKKVLSKDPSLASIAKAMRRTAKSYKEIADVLGVSETAI